MSGASFVRRVCALAAAAAVVACARPGGPHEQALAEAIEKKDVAAARSALSAGVDFDTDVHLRDESPMTLLGFLMDRMQFHVGTVDPRLEEIAAAVFAAGADPNYQIRRHGSSSGRRGLSTRGPRCLVEDAVDTGSAALIEVMLRSGLRVKDSCTGYALLEACRRGETAIVDRLVAAGADVDFAWTSYGRTETPLSAAVKGHHLAIVERLDRASALEWPK